MTPRMCVAFAAIFLAMGGPLAADEVDLEAMRATTEKYRDVAAALAEGYIPDPS